MAEGSSPEQTLDQFLPCDPEVLGDVTKNTGASPHAERPMARHGDMVLAALCGVRRRWLPV